MQYANELFPSSEAQRLEILQPGPAGPIVMVNLLKFKARAEYEDGRATSLSGRDAYAIYAAAVTKLIVAEGGLVLFNGDVNWLMIGQAESLWDQIALVQYPDRAALLRMSMSDAYSEIGVHRVAGLAGQLNIETVPRYNPLTKALGR
jgi:uncharacterized protein (DUF1330 family)